MLQSVCHGPAKHKVSCQVDWLARPARLRLTEHWFGTDLINNTGGVPANLHPMLFLIQAPATPSSYASDAALAEAAIAASLATAPVSQPSVAPAPAPSRGKRVSLYILSCYQSRGITTLSSKLCVQEAYEKAPACDHCHEGVISTNFDACDMLCEGVLGFPAKRTCAGPGSSRSGGPREQCDAYLSAA